MLEHNPSSYHRIPLHYRTKDEILPYCQKNGIPFLPYSPLFQGLLTGTFKENGNFTSQDVRNANPKLNGTYFGKYYSVVEKLKEATKDWGHSLNEIAINWLSNQEMIGSIIAGATSVEQFESNSNAMNWQLTEEQYSILDTIVCNVDNIENSEENI